MLDQVLDFVDIKPYYDLDVMKPNQNLYSLTADIITEIKMIFEDYLPYFAYVQEIPQLQLMLFILELELMMSERVTYF
jgi:hypothetical protein